MSVHSTPLEILQRIFRSLPPRTLFGCAARVCRFWNSVAKSTFASPDGRVTLRLHAVWGTPDDNRPFVVREAHPLVAFQRLRGGQDGSTDHWIAGSITVEATPLFWAETKWTDGDTVVGDHSAGMLVNPNVNLGPMLSNIALVPTATTFWPPTFEDSSRQYSTHEYPHGVHWTRDVKMTAADLSRWSSSTAASHSKGINNTVQVRNLTVHYEGLPPYYVLFDSLALFPHLNTVRIKIRPWHANQPRKKMRQFLHTVPFRTYYAYPTWNITCFHTDFNMESIQRLPAFWTVTGFLSSMTATFRNLTTIGDFALESVRKFNLLNEAGRSCPKVTTVHTTIFGRPVNLFDLSTCTPNHISDSIRAIAVTFPSLSELIVTFGSPKTIMRIQDHDTLVSAWRSALDTMPFLEVLRFEGPGLHSIMGAPITRPTWKSFFEQVGRGRTVVVGREWDVDIREPVLDEIF